MATTFKGFTFDREAATLVGPDGPVVLRPKTLALLDHLSSNPGRAISKDELLGSVWAEVTVTEDTLTQTVHELRKALGDAGPALIRTVPRRGYVFDAELATPATSAQLVPPDRPSIAVLPFTFIGTDQESGYFAEGVAEDIITELSRNKDLFVVARHSSFRVAQDNREPAAIGAALGVRHILTGSVRRAPDRLRLSVHLVGCETGNEIWAERYDRDIEDLFAIQLEIARTVTSTLAGRLMALADAASAAKAPESLDAYDHVLRAQHYLQRYTQADSARACVHLEKAAAIEPSYARPYSLLCLAGLYGWFWDMSEGGLTEVLATGEKALLLDDQDAKTHLALGVAQLFSYRHDRAIHHFERAVALNPNDDLIALEHGRLLMYLDRPDEGLKRVHEAMRLNPFHPNWYWNIEGRCHHTAGRYDQAIAAFERLDTPQFWNEAYLAACHAMSGRHEQAAQHVRQLREMLPDFRLATFRKAFPYSNNDTLERFLDTFREAGIRD